MKNITRGLLFIGVLFLTQQSYGQFSAGLQVSRLKLFGPSGVKNIGLSPKGEYSIDDKTSFYGGLSYYFPYTDSYTDYAYSSDYNGSLPSSVSVTVEQKVSPIHIFAGGKRYFVGDYEASFGVYGIVEAGFLGIPVKTEVGDYDAENYNYSDTDNEFYSNFTLDFGIGSEVDLSFGYLFLDFKLNIPQLKPNEREELFVC